MDLQGFQKLEHENAEVLSCVWIIKLAHMCYTEPCCVWRKQQVAGLFVVEDSASDKFVCALINVKQPVSAN